MTKGVNDITRDLTLIVPTVSALLDEVRRAREKFPNPDALFAALIEEVGELGESVLRLGKCDKKELLQVACVALRLYEEGDPLITEGASQVLATKVASIEILARNALAKLTGPESAARSEGAA